MQSEENQSVDKLPSKNTPTKKTPLQIQVLNLYYKKKKLAMTPWYEQELELLSEEIGLTKNQVYKYLWNKQNKQTKLQKQLDQEEMQIALEKNQKLVSSGRGHKNKNELADKSMGVYMPEKTLFMTKMLMPDKTPSMIREQVKDLGWCFFGIPQNKTSEIN